MITVALLSIVKDEGKIIRKMLESVIPYIDTYCIVDTGSTDNTMEIITEMMDEAGIVGSIIEIEWTNFADARNTYLEHGKGIADYGLVVDADRGLMINDVGWKDILPPVDRDECGMYSIPITHGELTYNNTMLIKLRGRDELAVEYKLPTHECLLHKEVQYNNTPRIVFNGIGLEEYGTGSSREVKHKRDKKLLEEYIINAELSDSLLPRAYYYLGQTLDEMGYNNRAHFAYSICMSITHWDAEAAWCAFKINVLPINDKRMYHKALDMCRSFMTPEVLFCKLWMLMSEGDYEEANRWLYEYNKIKDTVDDSGFKDMSVRKIHLPELIDRIKIEVDG